MSNILFYRNNLSESFSFEIEDIETLVNGDCYTLKIKGEDSTIEINLDEAGVIYHNRLTLDFIKGWTYARLNGKVHSE